MQNQEHYMQGVVARRNNFAEPILEFLEAAYKDFGEFTGRRYGLISWPCFSSPSARLTPALRASTRALAWAWRSAAGWRRSWAARFPPPVNGCMEASLLLSFHYRSHPNYEPYYPVDRG